MSAVMEPKKINPGYGVTVTKEEKYGWNFDSHQYDEFREVPLSELRVDHDQYQRHQSNSAIRSIAGNWYWIACGALIVARRPCGTMTVIEGAHRLYAAKTRTDIKTLPCLIWNIDSIEQEAAMFIVINERRKAMRSIEKYNAGQTAKDPSCVSVAALLGKHGYHASSDDSDRHCGCIGLLRKLTTENSARCEKLFDLCVQVAKGGRIVAPVLSGLNALEKSLIKRKDDQSVFDAENRHKLIKIGMETLHVECLKAATFWGKGGELSYAKGILRCINEGRNTRRIAELG